MNTRNHPPAAFSDLLERLKEGRAALGVIGLGYVGLPLVTTSVKSGFRTTGFDVDGAKIETLSAGRSYLEHIPDDAIREALDTGKFSVTADFSELSAMDAIVICVPTPLTPEREPDLSYIVSTAQTIAEHLRPGQLVVLESTTYPGTTVEVLRPILERGGLKSGVDFFLAYSPEREDPGNKTHGTATIPKVVGGDGPQALDLATTLYGRIVVETVPVSSVDTAEAVKLTENIFRSVNIALVNELKLIYAKMGIDIWEVIEAAKSKPFGFMPFYPGPGLGGHCIPIDPFYLTWRARQFGQETRFIELAGEINTAMPGHVVRSLEIQLKERFGKGLDGSRVLILGVAYKKNVGDVRESPAFAIIERLEERGAKPEFFDPHVSEIPPTREHAALTGRRSIAWTPESFGDFDAALICTDHDGVDYAELVRASRLVIDTRNATAGLPGVANKVVFA